jgi:hypothetical protein
MRLRDLKLTTFCSKDNAKRLFLYLKLIYLSVMLLCLRNNVAEMTSLIRIADVESCIDSHLARQNKVGDKGARLETHLGPDAG